MSYSSQTQPAPLPERSARVVAGLADSVAALELADAQRQAIGDAAARGYFRPAEEELLLGWFGRFLTLRAALWDIIDDVSLSLPGGLDAVRGPTATRWFLLAYAAACLVVRCDRLLVEDLAHQRLTQRKLNEGSKELRIPRKQFTAVLKSLSDPDKAILLHQAMRFANRHRQDLLALGDDSRFGEIVHRLPWLEAPLDPSKRRYFRRVLDYLRHAVRRRGASARQQAFFATLEASGRLVSELREPRLSRTGDGTRCGRIDGAVRDTLADILRPGDVLITRHNGAFTNLFLPGYWPHAALYVGSASDRERLGVNVDAHRAARWSGDRRTLEALKDGVLFRALEETLAVDAVAVIRPRLSAGAIATGIGRAVAHEGKLYNFDFDFFRSDRLVCTEVIYRAYDGIDGLQLPLRERAGRPTLSAEDLLDLALTGEAFETIAVFGAPSCPSAPVIGPAACDALRRSYRIG